MSLVKCGHCGSEHEEGTSFCPQTGKSIGPPAKSKATMFMFRAPGSPLPGSAGQAPPAPATAPRSMPTPAAGSNQVTGGTGKAGAVSAPASTGVSDTLTSPASGAGDSAIPTPVRNTGSRPTGSGARPVYRTPRTPSAPVLEVPKPPVAADLVPPPPVDPGLEGIVRSKITGEHSRATGGSGARAGSGPHRSRSIPSWVVAPDAGGTGSLPTAMFPAVDAPPRTGVALLKDAMGLYLQHLRVLLLTAAVVIVPAGLLSAAIESLLPAPTGSGIRFWFARAFTSLPSTLCMALVVPLVVAALMIVGADRLLGGSGDFRDHWRWVHRRRASLLGALVPAAGVHLAASFIPLGSLLAAFFLLFVPAVALMERESGGAALKRSFELVRGDWRRAAIIFVSLIPLVFVLMTVAALVGPGSVALGVLAFTVILLGLLPFTALATLLLYLDNRRTVESFDKEALRTQLDDLRSPAG